MRLSFWINCATAAACTRLIQRIPRTTSAVVKNDEHRHGLAQSTTLVERTFTYLRRLVGWSARFDGTARRSNNVATAEPAGSDSERWAGCSALWLCRKKSQGKPACERVEPKKSPRECLCSTLSAARGDIWYDLWFVFIKYLHVIMYKFFSFS